RQFPQMRFSLPKLTPVVKLFLIINIAVYFLCLLSGNFNYYIKTFFQIDATSTWTKLQIWRLISYQFLHTAGIGHIFFNMLGLFFLGPTLERHWGSKKFAIFYLSCGVAGGLFYLFLASIGFLSAGIMVGASGAILGMLAACAILFPHFVVFIFLFPVPIRLAAILFTFVYIVNVLSKGPNAGGDAAHLAGMAAGAVYVLSKSWRSRVKLKYQQQRWQKNINEQKDIERKLDRILQKVHDSGIQSLSTQEKRILKMATKLQKPQPNRK
ncbi:MAG: rhomboid family intramembrane serine protease, partial [Phycisphaerae bacterium]|nr:rhomboid family intramembrane serine protease [Phycisphaerae bacterium]